jgi:MFS family permease
VLGLTVFVVASLTGGFAQNEAMLLASRGAQGLGAAFASPNALALITTTFEPGPRRSRAFAFYSMMSGIGAAVGLLLGGWLTGTDLRVLGVDIEGWRLTFLINVPIGAAAALAAPRALVESERHEGELDVPGTLTATGGLLAIVYGISRAGDRSHGWGDTWTLTAIGCGVLLLLVFAALERRAVHPMLPGRVLADRDRAAAYAVMFLAPAAMFSMFFFLTLVLQNVLGESPLTTGLMFLPFSVVMILSAVVVSRLVQRVNPGVLSGIGALVAGTAVLGLSRLPYDDDPARLSVDVSYVSDVLPYVVLMPVGMAMIFIPTTMSVVHGVGPRDSGIASGVLNTMQQVGGALGLALLGTIAFEAADDKNAQLCAALADGGRCRPTEELLHVTFLHGATHAFVWGAAMMFLAAVIAFALNRIRHQDLGGVPQEVPSAP